MKNSKKEYTSMTWHYITVYLRIWIMVIGCVLCTIKYSDSGYSILVDDAPLYTNFISWGWQTLCYLLAGIGLLKYKRMGLRFLAIGHLSYVFMWVSSFQNNPTSKYYSFYSPSYILSMALSAIIISIIDYVYYKHRVKLFFPVPQKYLVGSDTSNSLSKKANLLNELNKTEE